MNEKTKTILIVSAGAVGLLAVVFVIAYFVGRKSAKAQTVDLPEATDWGTSLTASESADIERLAKALHDDMDGLNLSHDGNIYTEYAATTDRVFVGVANYFAEKYGAGENLAQWIAGETFAAAKLTTANMIRERLAKFGIE